MAIILAVICVVCLGLYVYLGARQRAVRADEQTRVAFKQLIDGLDQVEDLIKAERKKLVETKTP